VLFRKISYREKPWKSKDWEPKLEWKGFKSCRWRSFISGKSKN